MRKIIILCCIALLFACKSKKPAVVDVETTVVVVKPEAVETAKLNRAHDLGKRLLESCNTSNFKSFSASEATEKVRQNATVDKISSICKKINQRNGKFLGLNLFAITFNNQTNEYIFHYNINYNKKLYKRDLFVTINQDNKVSAITTKEVKPKPL